MSISCVNQSHETNFRMVILKVLALCAVDGFGAIVVPGRHGFVRFVMRGSEKVRFAQAFLLDTLLKSVCTISVRHLLTNRFCHVLFSSFFGPSGRYPGLWRLRRQRLPSQEISWSLEKAFCSRFCVTSLSTSNFSSFVVLRFWESIAARCGLLRWPCHNGWWCWCLQCINCKFKLVIRKNFGMALCQFLVSIRVMKLIFEW